MSPYPVLSQGLAAHWGAAVANGLGMIIGGVFLSLTLQVWTGWLAVAFIVIIGTALSFAAFVTGISEIGPMKATLLGTLEPVVASVTSAIALGTTFHTVELIGYACIIATVFIIILQKKPAIS
ncbi:EamA family transporter [uncultured Megasphaera sp.]|uniref:EamA family transporter n=1 Tax=uncultured Megasphaera sp. TaxID=165188 RepID=UPI0026584B08|nr:EamA family transporter [uncultured Megasphaera sp.]